ncbi:MAG: SU10 major capsid protein [Rectinemataceae bacterium]
MNFLEPTNSSDYAFGSVSEGELQKALSAGYGTDAAAMTGGRALIPEDIEMSMVNALAAKKEDFKLSNLLKNTKVNSTVHEYTRRNDAGDFQSIFTSEGGSAGDSSQTLERVTRPMKYMQTYREVTLQMQVARTIEDALASEKLAGTLTVLKGLEYGMFQADSSVIPVQFDSVSKQVRANASRRNLVDLRGAKISDVAGEDSITEIARQVFENGGSLSHAFMPSMIAQDFQKLAKDRLRFNPDDRKGAQVVMEYPTPFSSDIKIAGKEAGPDKMMYVKGKIAASGDSTKRPDAPTFALASQNLTASQGRGFDAGSAGTYYYTVFAINEFGVSVGAAAASLALAAAKEAKVTITPGAKRGTGYIICRSKKDAADGTDCREMVRVADSDAATTVVLDQQEDLPGTGEILYLSHDEVEPSIQFDQFLPLMKFDLYPTRAAVTPFLIVLFGTPDVKVPWFHGVVKNVGYTSDGFYN